MAPAERVEECRRHVAWVREMVRQARCDERRARWQARLETALYDLEVAEAAEIAAQAA